MDNFNLDTTLLKLGEYQWTARQAVEGVQIFGGIGSGKTSGSGRTLALKYLAAGFGGLVLTVKPEERADWQSYCELTGRMEDLIVISPENKNFFNFLEYESGTQQGDISATTNIVQVLKTVIRSNEDKTAGKNDDPFWEASLDMLMSNTIDLCLLAYGKVSVRLLYEIAQSYPQKDVDLSEGAFEKAFEIAKEKVKVKVTNWALTLPTAYFDEITKDISKYEDAACEAIPEARALRLIDQFIGSFLTIGEKTRTIIEFSFSGFLYSLLREPIYSLFCKHPSTFRPDNCRQGKIILLDLPVKTYHKAGRDCQILFKYIWQRAMEKGPLDKGTLPVFLWADEAQNFLHEYDPEYQATARSSKIATVYISQNLPNYHANMGGAKSDFKVKSFLGTLGTKIFHANADIETNKYASELIGDTFYQEASRTNTLAEKMSTSRTDSQKLDKAIRPEEFSLLKTGGDANEKKVTGYMHIQGDLLKTTNHILMQFDQNFSPQIKHTQT